uniref:patatin-like phospholipase family protein n=1 Tax=Roseovarius indicus TaxID=540747 RepID=UPI003B516027
MRQILPDNPKQIVFSGGGLRCFWQGGFMQELEKARHYKPERITGVSGGALAGAAWLGGIEDRLLQVMCARFEEQDSNLNLFEDDDSGVTPHQTLYCEIVSEVLDDALQARIADGPQFQILIAHPPDPLPPALSGAAMTVAYEAELHIKNAPHFDWAEKMGLDYSLVDANKAPAKKCSTISSVPPPSSRRSSSRRTGMAAPSLMAAWQTRPRCPSPTRARR